MLENLNEEETPSSILSDLVAIINFYSDPSREGTIDYRIAKYVEECLLAFSPEDVDLDSNLNNPEVVKRVEEAIRAFGVVPDELDIVLENAPKD